VAGAYLNGLEGVVIDGACLVRDGGGFGSLVGSLWNMLLLAEVVLGRGTILEDVRNASFMM